MIRSLLLITACCFLLISGCAEKLCVKTYHLKYVPRIEINLDGQLDEPVWNKANVTKDFTFPWEDDITPETEFRALYDDKYFYFSFKAYDKDIVFYNDDSGEMVLVKEDRCELYFSSDYNLKKYYCVEIDSRGRRLDYVASYPGYPLLPEL